MADQTLRMTITWIGRDEATRELDLKSFGEAVENELMQRAAEAIRHAPRSHTEIVDDLSRRVVITVPAVLPVETWVSAITAACGAMHVTADRNAWKFD